MTCKYKDIEKTKERCKNKIKKYIDSNNVGNIEIDERVFTKWYGISEDGYKLHKIIGKEITIRIVLDSEDEKTGELQT